MNSIKTIVRCGLAASLASAVAGAALANPAISSRDYYEQPFGFAYGEESQPFRAGTRDQNGNRVIVDGRIMVGDDRTTLPHGMWNNYGYPNGGAGSGGSTAVGNQLNVITQGSFNTVIIDSTQINTGDVNAGYLNGELNLHD